MITGKYADPTLKAIARVIGSAREFIVCGSRFFGDANDESDYDFVTEDDSIYEELLNAGWKVTKSEEAGYLDDNTLHILQLAKVQIIVVKSVSKRIAAREYIVANKLDRKKTQSWDKAYSKVR